jgi:hypothetical protein
MPMEKSLRAGTREAHSHGHDIDVEPCGDGEARDVFDIGGEHRHAVPWHRIASQSAFAAA